METVSAAGILFTDGLKVLAGYHPSLSAWSGIGGKAEEGESLVITAIRECCEEIYGLKPDAATLEEMAVELNLGEPTLTGSYAVFQAHLLEVLVICRILKKNGYTSQFYQFFPKDIQYLIEERDTHPTAEIKLLTLLPLDEVELSRESITPEFYEDIRKLMTSNA